MTERDTKGPLQLVYERKLPSREAYLTLFGVCPIAAMKQRFMCG